MFAREFGASKPPVKLIELFLLAGRLPPYVSMYGLSGPLEAASAGRADEPATFHLFGQAAALGRAEPAADVVARLVSEAQGVMGRFAGRDPAGF